MSDNVLAIEPSSTLQPIIEPVANTIVNSFYKTADNNADNEELDQLDRNAINTALSHLGAIHEDSELFPSADSPMRVRGEAKGLTGMSFLTDITSQDGYGSDGSEVTLDNLMFGAAGATPVIAKSGPQNMKDNYDIRERAGFFAKKSKKYASMKLSGPLDYPKEFSPPNSSQQSRRQQAEREAIEIAKSRENSNPRSGIRQTAGSRGLPGGLKLTHKETTTYFGNEARAEFFERYKWMSTQRQNAGTLSAETTNVILFPDSYCGRPSTVTSIWEDDQGTQQQSGCVATQVSNDSEVQIATKQSSSSSGEKRRASIALTSQSTKDPNRGRAGTLLSPIMGRAGEDRTSTSAASPVTQSSKESNNTTEDSNSIAESGKSSKLGGGAAAGRKVSVALGASTAISTKVAKNKATRMRGSVLFDAAALEQQQLEEEKHSSALADEADALQSGEEGNTQTSPPKKPSNVTVTMLRVEPKYRRKQQEISDQVRDFPFAPLRTEDELRVRTKVVIRTQSLLQGDSFEELKLVQKTNKVMGLESRRPEVGVEAPVVDREAALSGVSYHAQALLNATYDSEGNVCPQEQQQDGLHTHTSALAHAGVLSGEGTAAGTPQLQQGQAHSVQPFAADAVRTESGAKQHPHSQQQRPLSILTSNLTSTSGASTASASNSPTKLGGKPSLKPQSRSNSPRSNSHNISPLISPTKHKPTPTKAAQSALTTNAPKARGTKDSIYGPSKYRKGANALLPSLALHSPLAAPAHHHGQHDNSGLPTSGNTAFGDAILSKLNATAKTLQEAMLRETEQRQQATQAAFFGSQENNSGFVSVSVGQEDREHPHTVQFTASLAGHPGGTATATAGGRKAVDKHTTSGAGHSNSTAGSHSAGKGAAGGKHSGHATAVTAGVGHQSQSAPGTASQGRSAAGTIHHHSGNQKRGTHSATNSAPSTARSNHTATSTHTPNLERNVEVLYLDRDDFLGEKLSKLQHQLKVPAKSDKYNLVHPEYSSSSSTAQRRETPSSGTAALSQEQKSPGKVAARASNHPAAALKIDTEAYSYYKGSPNHSLSPYKANFSDHPVHTGVIPRASVLMRNAAMEAAIAEVTRDASADMHLDLDSATKRVQPVELICVDHRDKHNRKVSATKAKTGSLFQYLELKQSQFDFHGDISSDSDDEALLNVKRVDPAVPVSPLHSLFLHERGLSAGGEGGSGQERGLTPLQLQHTPALHLHGPQGIGLTAASDDNISVGSDSVDTSMSGAPGMSATRKLRRRIKHPKKGSELPEGQVSPRSKYIDSCIRKRLNPRASLILRKNFTKCLYLQHHGMGDEMAILFAEAIVDVPYIEVINISDNNLTDTGLGPIINAVVHMKDLVDLDISYNTIGPVAASSLSTYLAKETSPLQRLVLRRADVDDGECERFVTSLKTNRHLLELDLCENLIGSAENLNTVMPDLVTGGEALADLLRSDGCMLSSLKLGWNMIRLDGAADLCSSLIVNTTLTYLDLSFNSLGSMGGMALGDALQENKVLKRLNVANNSIDSVACLTICAGVLENEALEHVVFDGNPIGEQGAKTLMLLPTMVGSRVRISASSCNIGIRDANCWFDSTALVRKFALDLSNPFERAVGLLILYLIASHQTYILGVSEYYDPDTKTTTNLGLTEKVVVDYENKRLVKEQLEQIESLKIVQAAASNTDSALALFSEIDADGSGQLDEDEFGNLLTSMGLSMSPEQVRECMSEYDVDNGGVIELSEFTLFLRHQAKEAERKLKELTEFPIMCIGAETEVRRYVPPRTGTLTLVIADGFTTKDTYRVLSAADRNFINEIARQSGDLLTMTTYGVQSYKMRFNEAMGVAETLLKENSNKVEVLSRILPQMASAADARMLVAKLLSNNKTEIQKLRREIGFALKPMLGVMDGHYSLDLGNQMDKFCLNKLLEIGMTIAFRRAKKSRLGYGVLGDCSQKGNWSSFRNELFNGKPVVVSTEFASPMPRSGRLEFDFVSEQRVGKDDFILNDVRFTNMLVRVFQVRSDERQFVLNRLNKTRLRCDRCLNGDARTVYECPKERATEIGEAMNSFYGNLARRQEQIDRYRQREGIKVSMQYDPNTTVLTYKNVHQYLTVKSLVPVPPTVTALNTDEVTAVLQADTAPVTETNKSQPPSSRRGTQSAQSTSRTAPQTRSRLNSANDPDSDSDEDSQFLSPTGGRSAKSSKTALSDTSTPVRGRTPATAPQPVKVLESWAEVEALGGPADFLIDPVTGEKSAPGSRPATSWAETPERLSTAGEIIGELQGGIRLDDYMRRYVCVMASGNIQAAAKAARTVELLVNCFEYHFIYARHLELLCMIFDEYGTVSCSEFFGTYRVELVIALFACVVDIHNFEIVMRRLTPFEAGCVICRLGWLHIYNPMKPEGAYQLELSRREERIIVKTLAQLATAEPGDNLPSVAFRWEREMASMPGYELTEPWLTEDGLPRKGIWDVVYYAGEGKGKHGCKPMPKLRRSLLQLVFIEEADLISETDREAGGTAPLLGEAFMMANLAIWHGYLSYNEAEFKALKKGTTTSPGAKDKKKK